jgi:YVTN family beta-propeller protein
MFPTRRRLLLGAGALAGCGHRKGHRFNGYAFVANHAGNSVAVLDLSDFKLAQQIQLPASPAEVTAAGSRVFVLAPAAGSVYELEAEPPRIKRHARVARTALSMRMTPDGKSLWIAASDPPELVRVDLDSLTIAQRVRLPGPPRDFDLSRNATHAATIDTRVSVANLNSGKVYRFGFSEAPQLVRFRFDWEPAHLIVGEGSTRTVVIAEMKSGRALARLPLPLEPAQFCMKGDGGELFVSGPGMDAVVAIFPFTTEIGETLLAGRAPGPMAISAQPEYLFVANPASGDVTILDIQTRKLAGVVTVGQEPGTILFTPDHHYALVLNRESGDVAVIRMDLIRGSRSKTAPLFTMIPVGRRPVAGAVVSV